MRASLLRAAVAALALAAAPAFAHHSGAMFDRSKVVTLHGTVKAFMFANPHSWIRLMVLEGSGPAVEWDVEGAATVRMTAWGITPQSVKAGDKVTVRMHPLRDGRRGGSLIDVTLADGRLLKTSTDTQPQSK